MAALLHYEKKNKQIYSFNDSYYAMTNSIKPVLKKHNISTNYIEYLIELNNLINRQEESGVEFIRKEKFVFASDNYKLDIITKKEMKDLIIKGKLFMNDVLDVIK